MKIDPDVTKTARAFGIDARLIQAVIAAEGNIVKAVQCSIPSVTSRQHALEITCRSAVHAMSDFVKARYGAEFVEFWAKRWAPQGAANDPTGLNANWPKNVNAHWLRG